jgi:hypothetical protein
MGSQPAIAEAGLVPQHAEPNPAAARVAAAPYFSFTTVLMFSELMEVSSSFGNRNNIFRGDHSIAGAALGIQKTEKLFERVRIRSIPEVGSLAADGHQAFVLQFVEVMRERGIGYLQV